MRKFVLAVFASLALAVPASADPAPQLPPTVVDPCVYGEPADPTVVNADGSPAPVLPCPLGVWQFGPSN